MPDDFQEVQVPGHGTFRFPAGMTRDQMEPLLRSRVQELGGPQAVAPKPYTERALPWETPKPGQQQAQWNELPGALAEFGKHVYEGIKSATSLPGETFEAGYKGQVPQGLGGQIDQGDFEDRAFNLAGLAAGGGKFGKTPSIQPAVKEVQKILSPQSVSPIASEAAGSIRAASGTAARDTATTSATLEPYRELVNSLPDTDKLSFIDHVEGVGSASNLFGTGSNMGPPLRALADDLKAELGKRRTKLEAMPKFNQMTFIEEYLPHMFQDPKAAKDFMQSYSPSGVGKQGSGASLKKRVIPTYREGIAAGLKPVSLDPIEITMRYVASMDKFIASEEILEAAKGANTVRYFTPKSMGASGNPAGMGHNIAPSGPIPEGWVPLKGRGATNHLGQTAYAPEDWARVYNNYISRGFADISEDLGRGVDAFQRASNSVSAVQLGLSGYHAFNIATSGIASDIGRAVSNMAGGKFLRGFSALGNALFTPVREMTPWSKGKKFEQIYLGRSQGSPDMRRVVDLVEKAGGRGAGKTHASDYGFSAAGSFMTSWKRGALKMEMRQSLQNVKGVGSGIVELGKNVGRVMETLSDPLFKTYIPRMKNAALYDIMHDWLEANPLASHEEQLHVARKVVDAMDHRYGEMIQDNIFWNKAFKQSAQSAMLSYSWTMGLMRQVKRGVAADPRKLAITSKDYNPDLAGLIGAAVAVPLVGAIYMYFKTGKSPENMQDVMAPRTGGEGFGATVPSLARRRASQARVPETAMLPSHERDLLGWWYEPGQEFKNKFAALPRAGIEWFFPGPTDVDVSDYLKIVGESMAPISLQQLRRGHMEGSAMGPAESLMGIRPAPSYLQDPEGYAKMKENRHILDERRKTAIGRKQESKYGGPQE